MDLQKTLHEIPNYIKVLDAVTNELEQVKKQIISLRTGCLAGRSAGAAVGTVGTVISIIGFIGAPLTGGLSLAATAGGMTTGLVGGAAVGIAEGVQHHQKQEKRNKANHALLINLTGYSTRMLPSVEEKRMIAGQ
uniref:t-SNARE coiled-coil homology domain-containing protein n=1 Tax=Mesocestoides corti TaxID=53468 RepID=A0A5K3FVV6_MESCO